MICTNVCSFTLTVRAVLAAGVLGARVLVGHVTVLETAVVETVVEAVEKAVENALETALETALEAALKACVPLDTVVI